MTRRSIIRYLTVKDGEARNNAEAYFDQLTEVMPGAYCAHAENGRALAIDESLEKAIYAHVAHQRRRQALARYKARR